MLASSEGLSLPQRPGLKQTGFVEGENVAIKDRHETDRLPLVVADLLRQQVALIVGNTPAALAAKAATSTIPIIFVTGADPVQFGLVASLSRPGGNVTGISFMSVELTAKQLGLLRELRPAAARIAVLIDPKFPTTERLPPHHLPLPSRIASKNGITPPDGLQQTSATKSAISRHMQCSAEPPSPMTVVAAMPS